MTQWDPLVCLWSLAIILGEPFQNEAIGWGSSQGRLQINSYTQKSSSPSPPIYPVHPTMHRVNIWHPCLEANNQHGDMEQSSSITEVSKKRLHDWYRHGSNSSVSQWYKNFSIGEVRTLSTDDEIHTQSQVLYELLETARLRQSKTEKWFKRWRKQTEWRLLLSVVSMVSVPAQGKSASNHAFPGLTSCHGETNPSLLKTEISSEFKGVI